MARGRYRARARPAEWSPRRGAPTPKLTLNAALWDERHWPAAGFAVHFGQAEVADLAFVTSSAIAPTVSSIGTAGSLQWR